MLRVDKFNIRPCGCVAVAIGSKLAGTVARFRKLPKASDDFTEQMRKMKPHKQKVDA